MNIGMTGARGWIGKHLTLRLERDGHNVKPFSLRREIPPDAFAGCDAVVHLAGEPVAQRWTKEAKDRILNSRVEGTRAVVDAICALDQKPSVLVSASAVGYYGSRGDEILTETSGPGDDFLGQVAQRWESEALRAAECDVRVVTPRIGFVLGPNGGALDRMLLPFRLGIGGRLGSGNQWMSWVHLDDVCDFLVFALRDPQLRGAANLTAPNPVTNQEFTKALGDAVHRPTLIPVPGLALKILFGEMAEILLGGQRVIPEVATRAGFLFRYEHIDLALRASITK